MNLLQNRVGSTFIYEGYDRIYFVIFAKKGQHTKQRFVDIYYNATKIKKAATFRGKRKPLYFRMHNSFFLVF